jgi:predicted PurR-regulated permease PerM
MNIQKKSNLLAHLFSTKPFTCAITFAAVLLLFQFPALGQAAKDANKFLGNITTWGQVRTDFIEYWNQITGENESKWSSIEGTQNIMTGMEKTKSQSMRKIMGFSGNFTLLYGVASFLDG